MTGLTAHDIRRLFALLDEELRAAGVRGEVYVVGGAVMCLAYGAREATQDVDALFLPARELREAAHRIAARTGVAEEWLNDAAKGWLSERGEWRAFLDMANLRVMLAQPAYLLAMKCLAFRIGAEFRDEEDIRYLLRLLDIARYDDAVDAIAKFYPRERFPAKTLYALEEILSPRR